MNNDCRSESFGIQRFEVAMSWVLVESAEVFAQSSYLLA